MCFNILLSLLAFPYNHICSHSLISVSLISQSSTDSESSTQSSVGTFPRPAAEFAAVRSAEDRLSEHLQRVSRVPLDFIVSLHTPVEDGLSPVAIKEERNPRHTPSPQSASQCQHTYSSHADIELESSSYTTLRSSEECKLQTRKTNRESKNGGGKCTLGKDKEVRNDEFPETENIVPLPTPEAAHVVVREKRELPPGFVSGSARGHKPHLSNSHCTPFLQTQQDTTLRPHTPASDSSSYPELQNGLQPNHSDCPNSSKEVPLPILSTTEEQQAYVTSDSKLSKDRNADRAESKRVVGGYSQMTSIYAQAFTPPQRLAGPCRPSAVKTAGEWFKKIDLVYYLILSFSKRHYCSITQLCVLPTAIPTLLPYKPHGSSELFYMPQTVPELSLNDSDTTVESSHTGIEKRPRCTTHKHNILYN